MPWVSDFTYVAPWRGFVYGAFVIDAYARRSAGWRVSTSAHARFVREALEQAVHERRPAKGLGLVQHSDRGSQDLSSRHTRSFEAVEHATPEWVAWFDDRRLLDPIGNIPPAQAEANFHAALETGPMAA